MAVQNPGIYRGLGRLASSTQIRVTTAKPASEYGFAEGARMGKLLSSGFGADLTNDPRFDSNGHRVQTRQQLDHLMQDGFQKLTAAEVMAGLKGRQIAKPG